MSKRLIDKALEAAKVVVENQESVPVVVEAWNVQYIQSRHQIVISVMVATEQHIGYEPFNIWVTVDLETEEIIVQECYES